MRKNYTVLRCICVCLYIEDLLETVQVVWYLVVVIV